MTDDKTASQPEFKLRWYQFRLRTLLIFVFLVACVCSLIEITLRKAWLQRRAVSEIIQSGGYVSYGRPGPANALNPTLESKTSSVYELFGYDYFYDVVGVSGFRADDNNIALLDDLPKLTQLALDIRLLTHAKDGLKHLQKVDKLESLILQGYRDDANLRVLKELPSLSSLELRGYDLTLTDKCLDFVKPLKNLDHLALWRGNWTNDGIKELTHLGTLRDLTIYSSNNIDDGLVILERTPHLQKLSLEWTPITNAGLEHIKNLSNLEILYLFNTNIDDAGLESLKYLHSLNALDLSDTNITGPGLKTLSQIETLKFLALDGTKITDDGLLSLSTMRQLEQLNISNTNITLAGLKEFLKRLHNNEQAESLRPLCLIIRQTPAAKSLKDNPDLVKELNASYPDCILDY
ncbi:MAG: hypothetical protein ABSE63_02920 [Thermoguttaceae bacterium]|jgi:hypothetical protein